MCDKMLRSIVTVAVGGGAIASGFSGGADHQGVGKGGFSSPGVDGINAIV